ncbi:MAG TPA: hypothetical protein PK410_01610 [Paludibacteraceae bacterium]|nr:hypothetical protein [Paludibacteraceae bacterium]
MKRFVVTIEAYMYAEDEENDEEVIQKAKRMAKILDIGDNRPKLLELGEQPAGTTYYRKIL